jgi:hypothetical protein
MTIELDTQQKTACRWYNLEITEEEDRYVVTDMEMKKRRKKCRYVGGNLDLLLSEAVEAVKARKSVQDTSRLSTEVRAELAAVPREIILPDPEPEPEEAPEPEPEEAPEPEPEPEEELILDGTLPLPELEPIPTQAQRLRREVLDDEPPATLMDVILDRDGVPLIQAPKAKRGPKGLRDKPNRMARALRAILENPGKSVSELATIAGVTEPMLVYYHIQLKSLERIYREFGAENMPSVGEGLDKKLSDLIGKNANSK